MTLDCNFTWEIDLYFVYINLFHNILFQKDFIQLEKLKKIYIFVYREIFLFIFHSLFLLNIFSLHMRMWIVLMEKWRVYLPYMMLRLQELHSQYKEKIEINVLLSSLTA